VLPLHDIANYVNIQAPDRPSELPGTAWVDLVGRIPHRYTESIPVTDVPGFTHRTVGGIGTAVTPKHRAEIELGKDESDDGIHLAGLVQPASPDQRVTIAVRSESDPDPLLVDVLTDQEGRFWTYIPLEVLVGKRQPWEGQPVTGGRFEAWAETTNADVWAPTRSESCFFDFARKRRPSSPIGVRPLDPTDLVRPIGGRPIGLTRPETGERSGAVEERAATPVESTPAAPAAPNGAHHG
jgi:hypothetical protein